MMNRHKTEYHEHLLNRVRNNMLTRWLVRYINRKMDKAQSKWRLRLRYRKPRRGFKYGSGGGLRCSEARSFALYLVWSNAYARHYRFEQQMRWVEERKRREA